MVYKGIISLYLERNNLKIPYSVINIFIIRDTILAIRDTNPQNVLIEKKDNPKSNMEISIPKSPRKINIV